MACVDRGGHLVTSGSVCRGCIRPHPDTVSPNPRAQGSIELVVPRKREQTEQWDQGLTGSPRQVFPLEATIVSPTPVPQSQQAAEPCHPHGLGFVQVPWTAPVTLGVSVPGKAGQVNLFSLLFPLRVVPAGFWGHPQGLLGRWAWDHTWTPGLQNTLQREHA